MKNNWAVTSIISGIVGGVISYFLTSNWKLALISAVIVTIIVLVNNPKRRYMKAFRIVLSMFLILNGFFFEIAGNLSDTHYKIGSNKIGNSVSIFLIFLAVVCLILDYLERDDNLNGTIFSAKKNKVGDINGNGNNVNQTNV